MGRGFDSHLGYFQGQTEYYNHTLPSCGGIVGTACPYPGKRGDAGFADSSAGKGLFR